MATRSETRVEGPSELAAGGDGVGDRIHSFLKRFPTGILWLLVIAWSIPSLGLLINSFRTRDAQRSAPFWQIFSDSANGYGAPSIENYNEVLITGNGLIDNLLNSFG